MNDAVHVYWINFKNIKLYSSVSHSRTSSVLWHLNNTGTWTVLNVRRHFWILTVTLLRLFWPSVFQILIILLVIDPDALHINDLLLAGFTDRSDDATPQNQSDLYDVREANFLEINLRKQLRSTWERLIWSLRNHYTAASISLLTASKSKLIALVLYSL